MVAGRLQVKKGYYYVVLQLQDVDGKHYSKWISTGLKEKGNKKRAEAQLVEERKKYSLMPVKNSMSDMLFTDYMLKWLSIVKPKLAVTTYSAYESMVRRVIVPYFMPKRLKLQEVSDFILDEFYVSQSERVKQRTVVHYHAVIHKALEYAVKKKIIGRNPADDVDRPKAEKFSAGFYNSTEVAEMFTVVKGTKLEIPVLFAAFYGLRRSEVVGLKWSAIDFEKNTISITHTFTSCYSNGKRVEVPRDRTKNESSKRTLPLVEPVKKRLLELAKEQKENKRLCGECYCKDYEGYICVNEIGKIIKPDYISESFPKVLEENGLRRIRFHDLRHSCASLLVSNGVPMKQVQEWLGHSDFSTTANIYSHLEYSAKQKSAEAMTEGLGLALSILL